LNAAILSLALAYACLLFLLVLTLLRSQVRLSLKAGMLVLSCGFYFWHYQALQSFVGWPAQQRLPERFQLIGSFVVEPDERQDEPGEIFLWVRDLDSDDETPRSYRFDYDREVHQQIEGAREQQQQGERLVAQPRYASGGTAPREIEFDPVRRSNRDRKAPLDN
jgi:hypothetical protein